MQQSHLTFTKGGSSLHKCMPSQVNSAAAAAAAAASLLSSIYLVSCTIRHQASYRDMSDLGRGYPPQHPFPYLQGCTVACKAWLFRAGLNVGSDPNEGLAKKVPLDVWHDIACTSGKLKMTANEGSCVGLQGGSPESCKTSQLSCNRCLLDMSVTCGCLAVHLHISKWLRLPPSFLGSAKHCDRLKKAQMMDTVCTAANGWTL